MQLQQRYSSFRKWQQASSHYANRHEGEVRQCHNCGNEFVGNFCPICGQRAEVGRVGWQSCSLSPIASTSAPTVRTTKKQTL